MKNRLVRIIIFLLIGVGIGYGIIYLQDQQELKSGVITASPDDVKISRSVEEPEEEQNTGIGGPFEMINQDGETVTQDNYADQYKLVFFGFSFCPAVCPTELQKVAVLMNQLDEETAAKITPIFVSVDPERDTPDVMKKYVEQFHPKLVGLTGSQEQVDSIKQSYRVYSSKVENEMMEGYMVDHSSFLYFMSPDDNLIALYPSKDTADQIATDVKAKISE